MRNALILTMVLAGLFFQGLCAAAEDPADALGQTVAGRARRNLVYLDLGHSGDDPGLSVDGLREADLVLRLGQEIAKDLQGRRIKAVLSPSSGRPVSIQARVEAANRLGAFALVSLHVNFSFCPDQKGVRIFIPAADEDVSASARVFRWKNASAAFAAKSRRLALGLARAMGGDDPRSRNVQSLNLAVFHGLEMPAAVIECGYASNPETLAALKKEETISEMAGAISRGLMEFYRERGAE